MQHDRNTHPKDSPVTATVICRQHLPAHDVAAITRAMRNLVADGADRHAAGRAR
jgi:hypothetical protein